MWTARSHERAASFPAAAQAHAGPPARSPSGGGTSMRERLLIPAAATVAAATLFSVKAVIVKLMYRVGVDATAAIGLRMALALPVFAVLAWRAERAAATAITARQLAATAAIGVLGYHVASWLDFAG